MRQRGLMTLICGLLVIAGLAAWIFFRPSGEDRAIARIKEDGGKVQVDRTDPDQPTLAIDLSFSRDTDTTLKQVKLLSRVEALDLDRSDVTDAGLAGLPNLKKLDLAQTRITNAGLKHLGDVKGLQVLDLRATAITDAGLEQLEGLTSLKWLSVVRTQVTEAGLKKLKEKLPGAEIKR